MTLQMQHIIKHLFRAGTLEEVPREKLEALVEEYPSFGMARYLLSRKLRTEDAAHFVEETKKTNLYFTNPFWLQWLLENADGQNGATTLRADRHSTEAVSEGLPAPRDEAGIAPREEEITQVQQAEAVEEPLPFHSVSMAEEVFREHSPEEEVRPEEAGSSAEHVMTYAENAENAAAAETKTVEAQGIAAESLEKVETVDGSAAAVASMFEQPAAEEPAPPAVTGETPALVAEAPEVRPEDAAPGSLPETRPEAKREEEGPPSVIAREVRIEQVEEEPIFQSYHTIDYFASQGIKLSLDENPTDRLGKQMKSFTEWLKVMKRIPQQDIKIVPDIVAETKIQAEAAHSIEGREVLTEAMAEVLLKQGMRDKAAEVYRKLSLLNPDKSSYFATKIEQLKEF